MCNYFLAAQFLHRCISNTDSQAHNTFVTVKCHKFDLWLARHRYLAKLTKGSGVLNNLNGWPEKEDALKSKEEKA